MSQKHWFYQIIYALILLLLLYILCISFQLSYPVSLASSILITAISVVTIRHYFKELRLQLLCVGLICCVLLPLIAYTKIILASAFLLPPSLVSILFLKRISLRVKQIAISIIISSLFLSLFFYHFKGTFTDRFVIIADLVILICLTVIGYLSYFYLNDLFKKNTASAFSDIFRQIVSEHPYMVFAYDPIKNKGMMNDKLTDFISFYPENYVKGEHNNIGRITFDEFLDKNKDFRVFFNIPEESSSVQKEIVTPEGEKRIIRLQQVLFEADGASKKGFINLGEDITEQLVKNQKTESQFQRYRYLFNNIYYAISIYDYQLDKTIECNKKLLDILEIENKETYFNFNALDFSPQFQPSGISSKELMAEHRKKLLEKGEVTYEWTTKLKSGKRKVLFIHSRIIDLNNKMMSLTMLRDITDEKRAELVINKQILELNQKNNELQSYIKSNTELENFAYITSHDLREPIRSILSFSQLLERDMKDKLSPAAKDYLGFIQNASQRMEYLIRDILLFSRVNADDLNFEVINFQDLMHDVLSDLSISITENEANIDLVNLPEKLKGDPIRLRQLFQNLINNAIKFRKENVAPEIIIEYQLVDKFHQFQIQDNGIGIEEEYRHKVFGLFKRLHSYQEYEGTGIGLALCKKIAEQHWGSIELSDNENGGCTFKILISATL